MDTGEAPSSSASRGPLGAPVQNQFLIPLVSPFSRVMAHNQFYLRDFKTSGPLLIGETRQLQERNIGPMC